jgi:hypothetical protein
MDLEIVYPHKLQFNAHQASNLTTETVLQLINQAHQLLYIALLDSTLMDMETVFQILFQSFAILDSIVMKVEVVFLIVFQFLQSAQVDMNLMETELVFLLILN